MILGVYGAGGLGREVLELAKIINNKELKWDEFIFIVDGNVSDTVEGCRVFKFDDAKNRYGDELEVVMGIGEPITRGKIFRRIKSEGINSPTLIHPDVYIPENVKIGQGVVIQSGCFVSVGVTIEDYVLLQPKCAIGHDCVIGEGCVVSTFDSIAGGVIVGEYTYLGMGVSVMELVNIGKYAIVSMGAVVFKNISDEMIAMGNPARPVRKNEDKRVFNH